MPQAAPRALANNAAQYRSPLQADILNPEQMSQIGASLHRKATLRAADLRDDAYMPVRTFQSWKEIAQYMGRGVRTVQRWEAFGLPVHRPAGRERSAVFAIEHELDAWMQQTQTQLCRPLRSNGDADGALMIRIQELENEVRGLREQIIAMNGSRGYSAQTLAA